MVDKSNVSQTSKLIVCTFRMQAMYTLQFLVFYFKLNEASQYFKVEKTFSLSTPHPPSI